jgi:hypothetical protein
MFKNFQTALLNLLQQTDLNPRVRETSFTNPGVIRASNLLSNCVASLNEDKVFKSYQENNQKTFSFLKELVINYDCVSVLNIGCRITGYHATCMKSRKIVTL